MTVPGVTVPDVNAHGVTVPGVTVPDIKASGVTVGGADLTVPGVTAPGVAVPDLTVPDVTLPDVTAPALTGPDVTAPDVTLPAVVGGAVVGGAAIGGVAIGGGSPKIGGKVAAESDGCCGKAKAKPITVNDAGVVTSGGKKAIDVNGVPVVDKKAGCCAPAPKAAALPMDEIPLPVKVAVVGGNGCCPADDFLDNNDTHNCCSASAVPSKDEKKSPSSCCVRGAARTPKPAYVHATTGLQYKGCTSGFCCFVPFCGAPWKASNYKPTRLPRSSPNYRPAPTNSKI